MWADDDLAAFVAYRSQPEVARFQSWDTSYSMVDAERFLAEARTEDRRVRRQGADAMRLVPLDGRDLGAAMRDLEEGADVLTEAGLGIDVGGEHGVHHHERYLVAVGGDQHLRLRPTANNGLGYLEAVHNRHADVQYRDIRLHLQHPGDRLDRLVRLARHHDHVARPLEVGDRMADLDEGVGQGAGQLLPTGGQFDPAVFEREGLARIGMPREIALRHRLPHFDHLFGSDSYSAGYYSYLWSDVMAADTWQAFVEAGPWDKALAARMRTHILSNGNTIDRAEAYRQFRGRDPDVKALLAKRGFPAGQ